MNTTSPRPSVNAEEARAIIEACRFKAPVEVLYRPDPRGAEYGRFGATPLNNGAVHVRHESRGVTDYAMLFDSTVDFANWAKDVL